MSIVTIAAAVSGIVALSSDVITSYVVVKLTEKKRSKLNERSKSNGTDCWIDRCRNNL